MTAQPLARQEVMKQHNLTKDACVRLRSAMDVAGLTEAQLGARTQLHDGKSNQPGRAVSRSSVRDLLVGKPVSDQTARALVETAAQAAETTVAWIYSGSAPEPAWFSQQKIPGSTHDILACTAQPNELMEKDIEAFASAWRSVMIAIMCKCNRPAVAKMLCSAMPEMTIGDILTGGISRHLTAAVIHEVSMYSKSKDETAHQKGFRKTFISTSIDHLEATEVWGAIDDPLTPSNVASRKLPIVEIEKRTWLSHRLAGPSIGGVGFNGFSTSLSVLECQTRECNDERSISEACSLHDYFLSIEQWNDFSSHGMAILAWHLWSSSSPSGTSHFNATANSSTAAQAIACVHHVIARLMDSQANRLTAIQMLFGGLTAVKANNISKSFELIGCKVSGKTVYNWINSESAGRRISSAKIRGYYSIRPFFA